MTVEELAKQLDFQTIAAPELNRNVNGVYIGDLLSWVMGKAVADNVWLTIMSNINIIAVASLCDCACVLLTEGVKVDESVIAAANSKGINILSTSLSTYDAACRLNDLKI